MPKSKAADWWLYVGLATPAYFLIYFGLEGLNIVTGKYALYNYATYQYGNYKSVMSFYSFVPMPTLAPFFIVAGGLMIVGLYIHYAWTHGVTYKK